MLVSFFKQARTLSQKYFYVSALFLSVSVTACGGGGGASAPASEVVDSNLGNLSLGSIATVDFGSSSSANLSFSSLSGGEKFLVAFYSLSESGSTTYSTSFSSLSSYEDLVSHDEVESVTEDFHALLRNSEENIVIPSHAQGDISLELMADAAPPSYAVGESATFKVLNSLSNTTSYATVTASLRYVGTRFLAYRDTNATSNLSDSDINTLMTNLESQATTLQSTFGSWSDVDANGKFIILFTPVLNTLGGSGGIVTGYFWGGDLLSMSDVMRIEGITAEGYATTYAASNHKDIVFCHVPDESGAYGSAISHSFFMSNTGPLCMPHELQHAVNFNMRTFMNSGSSDPGWANEGYSHLAEDVVNNFTSVSNENPSRVRLYLNGSLASFIGGTNLAQRGGSYLFMRYLYEQAELDRFTGISSGDQLISTMLNSSTTGIDRIEAVTGESIQSLAADFFTAVYLSNTGLSSNSRYNFSGINLRSAQSDNRGTVLSGPPVSSTSIPSSGSVLGMSATYREVTGASIMSNSNTLTLTGSSGMTPGARVIRIQ